MSYYPEQDTHGRKKIKIELYLSSYAAKLDVKNVAGVDKSYFTKKVDLFNF